MKKFIFIQVSIILVAIIIILCIRTTFIDMGINDIKTYQDIEEKNCNLGQVFTDVDIEFFTSGEFEKYKLEEYEKSPIIAIVEPYNYFSQKDYILFQKVKVTKCIKGDIDVGEDIIISFHGGVAEPMDYIYDYNNNDCMMGIRDANLMTEGKRYLITLEETPLNEYRNINYYYEYGAWLTYLDIDNYSDLYVDKKVEDMKLSDFEGGEFFTNSEEILTIVNNVKRKLLEKYL